MTIMVGTILLEHDERFGPKLHAVKSVRKNGSVVLVSSDEECSSEGTTYPGFAERVQSGKFKEWSIVSNRAAARALVDAQKSINDKKGT